MIWAGIAILISLPVGIATYLTILYFQLCRDYLDTLTRIFTEKPLFIIPRGQQPDDAEDLTIATSDGLSLRACYWKTPSTSRKGVVFFGLEFGANRWSCVPYCEHLRRAGYDVFSCEPRNQGDSDAQPDYEPLQWVTDRDAADYRSALEYLKSRNDADPRGVGFFGISKGGAAGVYIAANDPYIRCVVTDGAFGTISVMVPYMRYWFTIYERDNVTYAAFPPWYFRLVGRAALRSLQREKHVKFPEIEPAFRKLAPRPLLMIHGANDSYIKPSMAQVLYEYAKNPKEFWLVADAKHNQALNLVGDEYRRRVLEFFTKHLS